MKKLILLFLFLVIFLSTVTQSYAYVYVNGYYRSNGTYVGPYVRSEPNGLRYDNYGYSGGSLYNNSYYDSGYSSSWYTPSYYTDPDYYYGQSLYDSYNSYNWDY